MSEIIKLYENVGIEKRLLCGDRGRDVLCGHVRPDGKSRMAFGCFGCEYKNDAYPPFTAEKQIELIKWLSKRCFYIEISEMADKSYGIAFRYQPADEYKSEQSECCTNKNFAEALAESINYIWQDLSEAEQEALRGILRA